MSLSQTLNIIASIYTGTASSVFMILFARRPAWRTTQLGRMLMTLVGTIGALCWIIVVYYLTRSDPAWVRIARAALLMVAGTSIILQTVIMTRLRRENDLLREDA